jgi:NodT family efflux transporter outer membrane factor (OMF) lipoprotein
LGQISNADVLAQEAALAQAQETLPPLEKQLALQRDLLTALAGQLPQDQISQKFDFASFHLPHDLPVSLPSKLVEHRPDVKAAEANLHSASAAIGVAVANRLPVLNLTADLGSSPSHLANLFAPQTLFYTLAGSVAESVFDGGTLLHKQRAAQAAFDQADAQYRSTVITAFQNVADSLRAIQADARTLKAAIYAETAAKKSLDLTREQLHLGQINNLTLLNAQQTYLQTSITRVQAEAARYADTAALFQALGGGWWNRNDVSPAAEANTDIIGIR